MRAGVEFVDDPEWYGASPSLLRVAVPKHVIRASVLFVADEQTLQSGDYPLVVVDLDAERPEFRVTGARLAEVEVNLNIANMDWEDFAGAVDQSGVFRGF